MMRIALGVAVAVVAACSAGSDSESASAPWRTGFDSTGDTIVARTIGEVPKELERRLVLEQRIGEAEGSDSVTFGRIQYVAVPRDGRTFVLDEQGPSIKLFDSTGKLVRFVGRKGGGPGEFEQVTGMDVLPNGDLALWDASHGRVNRYNSDGEFVAQWRVPITGFFTTNGLFTDREGSVALSAPTSGAGVFGESGYLRFDSTGTLKDTIRVPRWVDSTLQLTAMSRGPQNQMRASAPLPFARSLTWTWSQAGTLVSGPSEPYALYVTHTSERPLRIEGHRAKVPVLAGEATEARERVMWAMRLNVPTWTWNGPDVPAYKPTYQAIRSGYDGRIWVLLHSQAEELEIAESGGVAPPGGHPAPPPNRYFEPNVYDVFEASGVYLGRVRADRSQEVLRMRGDRVWGVLTDSLGVAYVARWRVEPPFER